MEVLRQLVFPRKVLVLTKCYSSDEEERDTKQAVLGFRQNNSAIQCHFLVVSLEAEDEKALCNFPVTFSF